MKRVTRNGDARYFDQIVSFETAEDAAPSRQTTTAMRRWSRAVDAWRRKAAPEQRDLEGPWT
ncbi:hypothetical protein [Curtobacterium sp. MCBA15_001]|uniref:hypothetical protein n=1 Tax=Curtobacterium sp. MCBA15_001 TaxID=1898731 RepID=UPI0008DEA1F3|nr:hypothetical protein [Curtobacterium sp. MCBA15_001]OIH95284.1 hypothetical protein BIU90_00795 [Curtobacterium sp. MCBA15_001]